MEAETYYFKRASSISVRILRILHTLQLTDNENTQSYLRDYAKEQERIKEQDKKNLYEFYLKTQNPPTE